MIKVLSKDPQNLRLVHQKQIFGKVHFIILLRREFLSVCGAETIFFSTEKKYGYMITTLSEKRIIVTNVE